MIHLIHSPRQLEWWILGNIGVWFICYSILTCCWGWWQVVFFFYLIPPLVFGHVRIWSRPLQLSPLIHPDPLSISVGLLPVCNCSTLQRDEELRCSEAKPSVRANVTIWSEMKWESPHCQKTLSVIQHNNNNNNNKQATMSEHTKKTTNRNSPLDFKKTNGT